MIIFSLVTLFQLIYLSDYFDNFCVTCLVVNMGQNSVIKSNYYEMMNCKHGSQANIWVFVICK